MTTSDCYCKMEMLAGSTICHFNLMKKIFGARRKNGWFGLCNPFRWRKIVISFILSLLHTFAAVKGQLYITKTHTQTNTKKTQAQTHTNYVHTPKLTVTEVKCLGNVSQSFPSHFITSALKLMIEIESENWENIFKLEQSKKVSPRGS